MKKTKKDCKVFERASNIIIILLLILMFTSIVMMGVTRNEAQEGVTDCYDSYDNKIIGVECYGKVLVDNEESEFYGMLVLYCMSSVLIFLSVKTLIMIDE